MSKNKNAATEDDLGTTHKLISMCHNFKLKSILDVVGEMQEDGCSHEEILATLTAYMKDIGSSQKWVEYNQVGCTTAEDVETSDLSKNLKRIKALQGAKIVQFRDVVNE